VLQHASFGEDAPGLPGRAAYPQTEGALWAAFLCFFNLLEADAMAAVFSQTPQLRLVLMQRAAASLNVTGGPEAETTASALMSLTRALEVRLPGACLLHVAACGVNLWALSCRTGRPSWTRYPGVFRAVDACSESHQILEHPVFPLHADSCASFHVSRGYHRIGLWRISHMLSVVCCSVD
jgi:hypothetical protein